MTDSATVFLYPCVISRVHPHVSNIVSVRLQMAQNTR